MSISDRMGALLAPIDSQVLMCDDSMELMVLARHMLAISRKILVSHLGDDVGNKLILDILRQEESKEKSRKVS